MTTDSPCTVLVGDVNATAEDRDGARAGELPSCCAFLVLVSVPEAEERSQRPRIERHAAAVARSSEEDIIFQRESRDR